MKEARGLLAIWADVDKENLIEFQQWHNCQHVAERVSIPGFHVGRRYRGVGEAPDFLMYYETDDSKVMAGKGYQYAINHPTPWTREAITHVKNTVRAIYNLLLSTGEKALTEAPFTFSIKFNLEPGSEEQFLPLLQKHSTKVLSILGIYRVRIFEMDDEVSNIRTEERKIHGGGPGQQRFLTFYEMAESGLPEGNAWKEAMEMIGKSIRNVQTESYWLDFVMYAPRAEKKGEKGEK